MITLHFSYLAWQTHASYVQRLLVIPILLLPVFLTITMFL